MTKADIIKHSEKLENAIEKLKELDDSVIVMAKKTNQRLDFIRSWKLSPRAKVKNPMPPICLYGTSLAMGKISALGKLNRDLETTKRNIERFG